MQYLADVAIWQKVCSTAASGGNASTVNELAFLVVTLTFGSSNRWNSKLTLGSSRLSGSYASRKVFFLFHSSAPRLGNHWLGN